MAHVLVPVELLDSHPTAPSLEALGSARRLGSEYGLTVYCIAFPGAGGSTVEEELSVVLSRHGADKILVAPTSISSAISSTLDATFLAICRAIQPAIIVFGEGTFAGAPERLSSALGLSLTPCAALIPVEDPTIFVLDRNASHLVECKDTAHIDTFLPKRESEPPADPPRTERIP